MKEISYSQIANYFKELANNAKFINDFVGFSAAEWAVKTASVDGLISPVLAMFKYQLEFEGEQNTESLRETGFAIMYNEIAPDDFEAQNNAVNEAEANAIKILSRIKLDSADPNHFLYKSFVKNSVKITNTDLNGNSFGVEVVFNMRNKQSLKVHREDWNDIPYECL